MTSESLSTEAVLRGLKDFQRHTVDYVFDRLYRGGQRRFLVADEVGLGKTMVARGVIARAIEHLRGKVDRIDVIYVCSNADIARQNLNRLRVGKEHQLVPATRLTMLPLEIGKLRETATGVNFVSFTPATSFDLNGGLGRIEERILLYWLLRDAWGFGAARAPINVLQGNASAENFRRRVDEFDPERIDADAQRNFTAVLKADRRLRRDFDALCEAFARSDSRISRETSAQRARFVGALRNVLAKSCVKSLEPDLVVLDEFQRFSHLLDGDDDGSVLARELFDYPDVRTLLLSATPYKMYTLADDPQGEDHYRDFLKTIRFLEGDGAADEPIEAVLDAYREALYNLAEGASREPLVAAKSRLEERLRRVMVRTERLASTPDRNGMLVEVPATVGELRASDALDYVALQGVARTVAHADTLEYWKSGAYLLSFLDDGYKLKRELVAKLETGEGRAAIARVLASSTACALAWPAIERYQAVDPGNARLRGLVSDVVDSGAWKLLWVPPSLPYYRLAGPFGDPKVAGFTKRLIFSSWKFVPRVIAGMISYEAERRMYAGNPEALNTPEARDAQKALLRFGRSKGRLTGMPVLALMYPSLFLARACDPAALAAERARESDGTDGVDAIDVPEILAIAKTRIQIALRRIASVGDQTGPVDERWYWAAPLLLDRMLDARATVAWLQQDDLAARWAGTDQDDDEPPADTDDRDHWSEHVAEACRVAETGHTQGGAADSLGRMPDDLVDVLAQLAIAGPAVTMLRALDRVVGGEHALEDVARIELRNGAGRTAWAFRSLFNHPEVMSMLRGGHRGAGEHPYWRLVLQYCVDGCLQSVLDEYVHVLRDHLGLLAGTIGHRVHEIADEIAAAMELRTSRIGVDDVALSEAGRTVRREKKWLRTHFALRFGDGTSEDGAVTTRPDQVRKAFNSPFWPFVLATTSVGQEGLDFHTYCHAVVHWNLPSNPVDLEQREGRVHRYKGHAVRKNVARDHGWAALEGEERDPWEAIFARARAARAGTTEIVPYWVYVTEGGARIERHVPALPLSRERERMRALSGSLAVYRMVFGQPRQEDLVRHLVARVAGERLAETAGLVAIDLAPRAEEA